MGLRQKTQNGQTTNHKISPFNLKLHKQKKEGNKTLSKYIYIYEQCGSFNLQMKRKEGKGIT